MTSNEKGNIKDLLQERVKRDMYMKFYHQGTYYMIDENLISSLYDVYTQNKLVAYIMNYEDKREVEKAYPGLFNYKQVGYGYEISKK